VSLKSNNDDSHFLLVALQFSIHSRKRKRETRKSRRRPAAKTLADEKQINFILFFFFAFFFFFQDFGSVLFESSFFPCLATA
jgi:hypothetical protein